MNNPAPPSGPMTHARVESLARATLANGFIQLVTHFPRELEDLGLDAEQALQQALRLAEEAIALCPELPDGHTVLGRLLLLHQSPEALEDALSVLEHALRLEPEHDPAEIARATALWQQGDRDGAMALVNQVVARGNMMPQPLLLRALLHLEAQDIPRARKDLERAVSLAPNSGVIRLDAAEIAQAAGDEEAASQHVQSARELLGEAFATIHDLRRL